MTEALSDFTFESAPTLMKNESSSTVQPNDEIDSQPWWMLALPLMIGAVVLVAGTWWSSESWPLAFTELTIAISASSVGLFLGFLFGIPRSTIGDGEHENSTELPKMFYRPSTNLEQVSDWLTKLLIGVGLVEMRSIADALANLGVVVQNSVGSGFQAANIITQATVVSFLTLTFFAAFLWTRIHYGPLQMRIDRDTLSGISQKFERIESALEDQKADTEKALKIPGMIARGELASGSVPAAQNEVAEVDVEAELAGWPETVRRNFEKFQNAPRVWDSDPCRVIFKGAEPAGDGLILEASVAEELPDVIIIQLTVRPLSEGELNGVVTFLLHPTLAVPIRHVMTADNRAVIKFPSQGWFTAVAIANNGKTVLSLDLRKTPGIPKWFLKS
jgi:hypothetical protein